MARVYDKWIGINSRDITSHYHFQDSPCILPLDPDNLQKSMLFVCHDRIGPRETPLASYQNSLQ